MILPAFMFEVLPVVRPPSTHGTRTHTVLVWGRGGGRGGGGSNRGTYISHFSLRFPLPLLASCALTELAANSARLPKVSKVPSLVKTDNV